MPTVEQDLHYLQSASEVLEDFLLSKELYWPLTISPGAPADASRLSLGGLLMADARLRARNLSGQQAAAYDKVSRQIQAVRDRWRSHWEMKAKNEFPARLRLWQNSLEEILQNPERNAVDYRQDARWRAMVELLQAQASALSPEEERHLNGLDTRLRGHFKPGDFIWEEDLSLAFPRDSFWFLYGTIR